MIAMWTLVVEIALVWAMILVAALAVASARASSVLARVLWLDTLALVLVAVLALVGYARDSTGYLDAALVLALLAFAGTLAATRYHAEGGL